MGKGISPSTTFWTLRSVLAFDNVVVVVVGGGSRGGKGVDVVVVDAGGGDSGEVECIAISKKKRNYGGLGNV